MAESRHPCLFPDNSLQESLQSFTIKYKISCGCFADALTQFKEVPYIFTLLTIINNMVWNVTVYKFLSISHVISMNYRVQGILIFKAFGTYC